HSAIARSSSSLSIPSTAETPRSPSTARPHSTGRPTSTARAPSATGNGAGDRGEDSDRRGSGVELTSAVIRDDNRGSAGLHGLHRIVGAGDTLDDDGQLRDRTEPCDIRPGENGIDERSEVRRERRLTELLR